MSDSSYSQRSGASTPTSRAEADRIDCIDMNMIVPKQSSKDVLIGEDFLKASLQVIHEEGLEGDTDASVDDMK
jgi:hypothetical protein